MTRARWLKIVCLFVQMAHIATAQEYTRLYHPNGVVASEGMMVAGKPDGVWKTYYENGTLKSVGKRTDFLLDSVWRFYDEEGRLTQEISYFENKKNGFLKEYSADGEMSFLSSSVLYINNLKQGEEIHFLPDGAKTETIPYIDNKREGKGYQFAPDGTIITILVYENDNLVSSQAINRTNPQGEKTGTHISFFPNGAMKTEAMYANGKLHGMYKLYDQHEQLVQVGSYDNDTLVFSSSSMAEFDDPTEKKTYYPDSTVKTKGAFRGKTPIGVHRQYDKDGKIVGGEFYDTLGHLVGRGVTLENGDRHGEWTMYYPSGKKESEGQYANGKKSGLWKFYYPDETLKQTGYFVENRYSGVWEFYNAAGDIQKREEYANGEKNGLSVEYDDEGEKVLDGMYKNGSRQGFWTDKTGDLIHEGEYRYGEKSGTWRSSYLNGSKAFKGNFFADKPDGHHMYFFKNGQVEHDERWRQGKPVKSWNYYDEKGHLRYTIYYKDGKESRVISAGQK